MTASKLGFALVGEDDGSAKRDPPLCLYSSFLFLYNPFPEGLCVASFCVSECECLTASCSVGRDLVATVIEDCDNESWERTLADASAREETYGYRWEGTELTGLGFREGLATLGCPSIWSCAIARKELTFSAVRNCRIWTLCRSKSSRVMPKVFKNWSIEASASVGASMSRPMREKVSIAETRHEVESESLQRRQ